jgi:ribosomal protein L7/L12
MTTTSTKEFEMAVSARIRSIANILDGRVNLDVYALLALVSELDTLVDQEVEAAVKAATTPSLADVIENSDVILACLANDRKIAAIKELRAATSCSLMDAKNAVMEFDGNKSPRYLSLPGCYQDGSVHRWYQDNTTVTNTNRPEPPF